MSKETVSLDRGWVSFFADVKFLSRCGFSTIHDELREVFGKDMQDIFFMDTNEEETKEEQTNSYVLVKCKNYFKYVKQLKKCKYIVSAIETFDNPYFIPEEEVLVFRKNIEKQENSYIPQKLISGDIVKVKDGCLKGMFGLVLKYYKSNKALVFFKFHSLSFQERYEEKRLVLCGNFIDKLFSQNASRECTKRIPVLLPKDS